MEHTLNNTDFLVSQTDSKGKILFANEDFCKIAGYTLEELIGQPHDMDEMMSLTQYVGAVDGKMGELLHTMDRLT